jgi:hypothetical protein
MDTCSFILSTFCLETVIIFTRKDVVIGEDIQLFSRCPVDFESSRITAKAAVAGSYKNLPWFQVGYHNELELGETEHRMSELL